jgi:hypothetical protein
MNDNEKFSTVVNYDITEAAISEMREEYMALTVKGPDDKEGYKLCKQARINVKNKRIDVEKKRKELKADALAYGRMVDSKAKEITEKLKSVENYLQSQQNIVDDEIERQRQEKIKAREKMINERVTKLTAMGYKVNITALSNMSDEDYKNVLADATAQYNEKQKKEEAERIEQQRIKEEHEKLKAENARLKKAEEEKQAELDKIKREQEEQKRLQEAQSKTAEQVATEIHQKDITEAVEPFRAVGVVIGSSGGDEYQETDVAIEYAEPVLFQHVETLSVEQMHGIARDVIEVLGHVLNAETRENALTLMRHAADRLYIFTEDDDDADQSNESTEPNDGVSRMVQQQG